MVLLLTNKKDVHPTSVLTCLREQGYPVFRLNTECLLTESRMAEQLETVLREWAKRNHVEYDAYTCFYQWRDENNLVPHEETDCRTMRLVFRPAH